MTHFTEPHRLERYAFLWSEARLIIAAIALAIGGIPPLAALLAIAPALAGIVGVILTISWIISGVAAAYLLYRWATGGMRLFGANETRDTVAFFVMVVSGLNLGLTGLSGNNLGMSISSSYIVFVVAAILYLVSAYHLYRRWKAAGERIFV